MEQHYCTARSSKVIVRAKIQYLGKTVTQYGRKDEEIRHEKELVLQKTHSSERKKFLKRRQSKYI